MVVSVMEGVGDSITVDTKVRQGYKAAYLYIRDGDEDGVVYDEASCDSLLAI